MNNGSTSLPFCDFSKIVLRACMQGESFSIKRACGLSDAYATPDIRTSLTVVNFTDGDADKETAEMSVPYPTLEIVFFQFAALISFCLFCAHFSDRLGDYVVDCVARTHARLAPSLLPFEKRLSREYYAPPFPIEEASWYYKALLLIGFIFTLVVSVCLCGPMYLSVDLVMDYISLSLLSRWNSLTISSAILSCL
jgi:hypothetical protein